MARLNGVNATVEDTATGVAIRFNGPQSTVSQLRAQTFTRYWTSERDGRDPFSVCACARPYRNEARPRRCRRVRNQAEAQLEQREPGPFRRARTVRQPRTVSVPGRPDATPRAYGSSVESSVDETVTVPC